MIFREATPADHPALLRLSRIPMPGNIQMIWGLQRMEPPPECGNLRAFVLDHSGEVLATSMCWDWPDGQRYLGGLRLHPQLRGRVPRSFWTQGYEAGLDGTAHAWTCIGAENTPARRLLLSSHNPSRNPSCTHRRAWLPCYSPRQELRSWFVPLPARNRRGKLTETESTGMGLRPDDRRYAAVHTGYGPQYRLARLSHLLGLPGLPRPHHRIRIAHAEMPPEDFAPCRRRAKGLDGLIITVPGGGALAERWRQVVPFYASVWDSTLYSVHWDPDAPLPAIPAWKGSWL